MRNLYAGIVCAAAMTIIVFGGGGCTEARATTSGFASEDERRTAALANRAARMQRAGAVTLPTRVDLPSEAGQAPPFDVDVVVPTLDDLALAAGCDEGELLWRRGTALEI